MTAISRRLRVIRFLPLFLSAVTPLTGCDRERQSQTPDSAPDEPSPAFRNVATPASYVGDAACSTCHASEASVYRQHAMARSFHRWTAAARIETRLDKPIYHAPTGFYYSVVDVGRDFSPGYRINNARFDRLLPDRCIACHSSYPTPLPFVDGKSAELRAGIGCERCHGPGALHVSERLAGARRDTGYDNTIVNPARLPLERRLDVCEQCHVHTPVTVLREGRNAFNYLPSQPLRDQFAFFKVAGDIDVVSHADLLPQPSSATP